jgi:hypothetical protein
MLQHCPAESFKIVGVSFDGRQEAIAALQAEQAVMLVREPNNVHDPNAVAVKTLQGHSLGYVPKELTVNIQHDVCFGHIQSVGQNDKGLWGAFVIVRPGLTPLSLDAFPLNLASHVNLSSELSKPDWDRLRKETYKRAGYKCEVSGGVGAEWPVEVQEQWRFYEGSQTLQLVGLMALHPDVHLAKHTDRQPDDARRQHGIWILQGMNQWSVQEAEQYLKYIQDLALQRSSRTWRFDMSWLQAQSVQIPSTLQALCL